MFIQATIKQFKNDNLKRVENTKFEYSLDNLILKNKLILKIDKLLFRQIFYNIFTNALDAFNGKGKIKLQLNILPRQTALNKYSEKIILGINETILETIISDNGKGLEEDQLEKVFAPFYTNKPEGNGLGLAVAWKIIKTHGGEITAENVAEGKGAAFRLLMPTSINAEQGA